MNSIENLFLTPLSYLGEEITLFGIFIHDGQNGFLVNQTDSDDHLKIQIRYDGLLKVLFKKFPAYGGGKFLYEDKAKITGIISRNNDEIFCELTSMSLFSESEENIIV